VIALLVFVALCIPVGLVLGVLAVLGAAAAPAKPKATGLDLGRVIR